MQITKKNRANKYDRVYMYRNITNIVDSFFADVENDFFGIHSKMQYVIQLICIVEFKIWFYHIRHLPSLSNIWNFVQFSIFEWFFFCFKYQILQFRWQIMEVMVQNECSVYVMLVWMADTIKLEFGEKNRERGRKHYLKNQYASLCSLIVNAMRVPHLN